MSPRARSLLAILSFTGFTTSSLLYPDPASAQIEEIVVTAQKRAESIQDVPISVSAFDAQALEALQIDGFADLQFNVPNVSYTKTNFSGNNFQIRGIGNLLIAGSADSGVAMHVNDVYLNSPRIFETEYYDMAQVEILRGPQGTLFGRNATGGAVNLKTAKPEIGIFSLDAEVQYGNYDHAKTKGAINIPIGETMAARFAGIYLDREGYTDDIVSGDEVDGRTQYSVRGSFRWEAGERTTIDLMAHYFDEDSDRSRSQKQTCIQDPSPILGCLPDGLAFETVNPFATAGTLLSSDLLLGPLGLFNFFADPVTPDGNPSDLRKVRLDTKPDYDADETFVMTEINHQVSGWLDATLLAGYQDTQVLSRQDYNGTTAELGSVVIPTGFCSFSPAACSYYGLQDGGPVWTSTVNDPKSSIGAIAGGNEFRLTSRGGANDISRAEAEQWSTELRFTTNFDGPWNFLLSGYYLDFESTGDYNVKGPVLDYPSLVLANGALAGNPNLFATLAPGFFDSVGDDPSYELESYAFFGEAYWQATDTIKLTGGLRWTKDDKTVTDRQVFLSVPAVTDVNSGITTVNGNPVGTINQLIAEAAVAGLFDADPNLAGNQEWRNQDIDFDEVTGRFVVDWTPDLSFTDATMVYASYSRGYKGGGINPPIDTALFPDTPVGFDSEDIDAYEIGTKNSFWDNRIQANMSAFFYDYGGLQIGKIVNRTSLNENTDAEVFGFEGEFFFAPDENWLLNAQISYLDTELDDYETIDPRDPSQGRDDVAVFADFINASNCALGLNGLASPSDNTAFVAAVTGAGAPYIPTGRDLGSFGGGAPNGLVVPAPPGIVDSAVTACDAINAIGPLFGYEGFPSGAPVSLDGNQLLSPEWKVSLGAQYTWYLDNGWELMGRFDYYWQDKFYSTTFNRPQDEFDSFDIMNAQVMLTGTNAKWYARAFVQNLEDDDEVTGTYQTDPASGLFTNLFLVEPRLYGLTLGISL